MYLASYSAMKKYLVIERETNLHEKHMRDVQLPHILLIAELYRLSEYLGI